MSKNVRTALVTGANRGLGYETARRLAKLGYRLLLTARDPEKGRKAAGEVRAECRGEVTFLPLDISDERSIRGAAAFLEENGRMVDLLVNNAAITIDGFNLEVARRTIDTNFYGPVRLTDALLPLMPDGATIVMVSSGAGELSILSGELKERFSASALTREGLFELAEGFVDAVARGRHAEEGWPGSAYGVSKAALNAFVRVAAPELAGRGIGINAVCPGWVRTGMGGPSAPRSIAEGAESILSAALLEGRRSGGFYRDGKTIPW